MREPLPRLAQSLGHGFSDPDLLEGALTHRSAGSRNNERLEFLGDAILSFLIAEELYAKFPQADEGQLSRLRALLVGKEPLVGMARELNLGAYLNLGAGELRSGGQSRDSILADAFEAVIAAVYLDGGLGACRRLVQDLFCAPLEKLRLDLVIKDPKTQLQEYLQGRKLALPLYSVVAIAGNQHAQEFSVRCLLEDLGQETLGHGSSRRRAEQAAAQAMLYQLRIQSHA